MSLALVVQIQKRLKKTLQAPLMVEISSDGFITFNGGLLRGRTAHLSLRSDNARGRGNMFGLWCHFNREIGVKDERKWKKLRAFLNF